MTETPQDPPQEQPSSAVGDAAAGTPASKESPQELMGNAGSNDRKKPWWKFWN
jgi:hypothetical protein